MGEYLSWTFFWKFIKFGVVGFSGVIVDFGFTYICKEWLVSKYKKHFYLSKLFAIAVVTIWNFLANYFITFG